MRPRGREKSNPSKARSIIYRKSTQVPIEVNSLGGLVDILMGGRKLGLLTSNWIVICLIQSYNEEDRALLK